MLFNHIDGAFYINLNRRVDRRDNFEKQIQKIGIEVERFSATEFKSQETGSDNWNCKIACTHSHFRVVQKAKDRKWNNVLIFEDDCIFAEDFINKTQQCINEIKNLEWNILYLGGEPNNYCNSITTNLCKVTSGVYGTHAYVVNSNFFDKILSIPYTLGIVDQLYMNIVDTNYMISKELLVWQDDSSYSDLWNQYKKSYDIYKSAYKKWIV